MKTIAIHLRLETASHRKRIMGIFRRIGATAHYDIRIVPDEESLCKMLSPANAAERPDGLISGVPHSEDTRRAIGGSDIPFVGIGMSEAELATRSARTGFVLNDNEGIGRAAAEFFLRHGGYRSFAYVPDERGRIWSQIRGKSFVAALSKAGKSCSVFRPGGADATALADFLAHLPHPSAVLAAWDGRAAEVIHAANKANLKVPDDISVLGVDDDVLICEHTTPPLSSIRTDAEGMGEAAAHLLLGLMRSRSGRKPAAIRCPILGISERRTTGTPAPAASLIDRALAFIDAEATGGIKPDDVARYLKVSRRLLDLRFREWERKSVTEVIAERKLKSVLGLLANSGIAVKDVFRQSGFGDVSYATKLFRKATGVTPETWRARHAADGAPAEAKSPRSEIAFERLAEIGPADARALSKFARALDPEATFDLAALRESIRGGATCVYVLRRKSRLVASATAVRFTTPTGSHCRIEDVVVDERLRGQGLGRRIMADVLDTLRRDGVTTIELTSRPARTAANALYRALGFQRHLTNVYKLKP